MGASSLRPAAYPSVQWWNPVAVGGEQGVDKIVDLVEVEFRRGMRVEHRGLVDVVAATGERRLDRQLLHVYVGADHAGQLRRKCADAGRLDAVAVDEARHLDG